MFRIDQDFARRRVLRGMLGGTAVSVGLPLLDVFLNTNGDAFADGKALPPCYGTWFAGLGLNHGRWEPKTVGPNYDMNVELACLEPFKKKINIYSGLRAFIDGRPNQVHNTGTQVSISGSAAKDDLLPTLDVLIADGVGSATRFRSIEVNSDGSGSTTSRRSAQVVNPPEMSPLALYTRIFGPEFVDPNAGEFQPNPEIMVRRSALSAITDRRKKLEQRLGAADRSRLDQYFTALRELEQRLDIQLQRPAPMPSCVKAASPEEGTRDTDINNVLGNNLLFAKLVAHALACGQTQVINMTISSGGSNVRASGNPTSMHTQSHEEAVDTAMGVQPELTKLMIQGMTGYRDVIATLDSIKEGAGTLLDRCVVLYCTDTGHAALHGLENMPMITAGGAAGRLKTGIHVNAQGDTVARVGLTVQHAMGMSPSAWGTESNRTTKVFSEVLA